MNHPPNDDRIVATLGLLVVMFVAIIWMFAVAPTVR